MSRVAWAILVSLLFLTVSISNGLICLEVARGPPNTSLDGKLQGNVKVENKSSSLGGKEQSDVSNISNIKAKSQSKVKLKQF